MKKTLVILGVLLISVVSSFSQQVAKSLTAANGEFIGFLEYKPTDYNTGTKYPVIIFLHGIGERGNGTTDLQNVAGLGIPGNIKNGHTMRFFWNGKWETFLVLSPQLNTKYGWWPQFYVDEMYNYALKNLSVDPNRIFLTGLSLGGGGVWSYVLQSPENAKKFAAIGVSCGTCQSGNYGNIAQANLPTWAWHAADDGTVGAGCSSSAISNINSYNPAVKPYLTIWPTGQHWIWGRVYSTGYEAQHPNIYEWFLGQNRSLPVNQRPVANAGPDQTISKLTGTVTLNGGGSRDNDGNIVQYIWSKVSGPSYGTISAEVSAGSSTIVTGLTTPGTYVYELRVIDNRSDWTVDQVTITVSDQGVPVPIGNKGPIANAGSDVSLTLPNNSASLNASGSSDPDGYITSYAWTKVSGPSQFTLNNANSANASVTNLAQGTYTFRVTVKDNNNAANTDDINIIVNGSSQPVARVANAGSDISISLPTNSTTLNASASNDPGGTIKQYEWSKISGPSQYAIANTRSANTTLSNLVQGTYQFNLTVWDHNWVPSSDSVTVTVNQGSGSGGSSGGGGDFAHAGGDINISLPTNSVTMNGSASGAIKTLEWRKISGPQATITDYRSFNTTITGLVQGTYTFELRVWDQNWVPHTDTVTITVGGSTGSGGGSGSGSSGNGGPANAGADITISLPTNSVTMNGSSSVTTKTQEWRKISGPQATITSSRSFNTTITGLVQGTYSFELRIWNQNWVPYADTVIVTVNGSGSSSSSGGSSGNGSISNAGADIYLTLPTNSTTLNGSASYNPQGIKAYEWSKVSGPGQYTIANPKSVTTTLSNLVQGVYKFRLTVWNHNWVPYSDSVDVVVKGSSSSGNGSIANAGSDIYITLPLNSTTLNGSASGDPSGAALKAYTWRKLTGPDQYTIVSPKSATSALTNLTSGNYSFELRVWNKDWVPYADTVFVVVMSSGVVSSAALGTTQPVMTTHTSGAGETTVDKLTVYPNPAHGMINVQSVTAETGKAVIIIYDVSGKKVQEVNFEKTQALQQNSLNVTRLAPGVYNLEVIVNNKRKMITKFIKQ